MPEAHRNAAIPDPRPTDSAQSDAAQTDAAQTGWARIGAGAGPLFEELLSIMARLRGPQGCPWDRAQTATSIKPYLLEEAYEVLEALESGDAAACAEELGDVLFQIVFHAQLAEEAGRFSIFEVLRGIGDKMVRRHPHVFGGEVPARDAEEVLVRWEAHKRRERQAARQAAAGARDAPPVSALDGVPRALPGLLRAQRMQEKAKRVSFDWPSIDGVMATVEEEWRELLEARRGGEQADVEAEFGDLLFSVVNYGRWLHLNAEEALQGATSRFAARFRSLEAELAAAGRSVEETPPADLDALWERIKRRQATQPPADDDADATSAGK